jgi:hypothetical protein
VQRRQDRRQHADLGQHAHHAVDDHVDDDPDHHEHGHVDDRHGLVHDEHVHVHHDDSLSADPAEGRCDPYHRAA